jgi:hypothetical protein
MKDAEKHIKKDKKDKNMARIINNTQIDISIASLKKYITDIDIEPILSVLETMKQEPTNKAHLKQLSEILDTLGTNKGAIFTYAPYVTLLLTENLFED